MTSAFGRAAERDELISVQLPMNEIVSTPSDVWHSHPDGKVEHVTSDGRYAEYVNPFA